jgi:hypothetical protein
MMTEGRGGTAIQILEIKKIKKNNSISIKAYAPRSHSSRNGNPEAGSYLALGVKPAPLPPDLSNRSPMMTDGRGVVPDPRNNIRRIGEEKLKQKK